MPRNRVRTASRKEKDPNKELAGLKAFLSDIHEMSVILWETRKHDGELENKIYATVFNVRQKNRKKAADKRARKNARRLELAQLGGFARTGELPQG